MLVQRSDIQGYTVQTFTYLLHLRLSVVLVMSLYNTVTYKGTLYRHLLTVPKIVSIAGDVLVQHSDIQGYTVQTFTYLLHLRLLVVLVMCLCNTVTYKGTLYRHLLTAPKIVSIAGDVLVQHSDIQGYTVQTLTYCP